MIELYFLKPDFEGDKEECVCVMIPESMDFDIFNDFASPQRYSISKACYVDGHRQDNAALIYLRVTELILQPGEQQVVNVIFTSITLTKLDKVCHIISNW